MLSNLFSLNYSNSVLFAIISVCTFLIQAEIIILSPDFYNLVAFTSFIVFISSILKDTVSNYLETSYVEENTLLTKSIVDSVNNSLESLEEEVAIVHTQTVLNTLLTKTVETATPLHSLNFADQLILEYSVNTAIYTDLHIVLQQYINTQKNVFATFRDKVSKKPVVKK